MLAHAASSTYMENHFPRTQRSNSRIILEVARNWLGLASCRAEKNTSGPWSMQNIDTAAILIRTMRLYCASSLYKECVWIEVKSLHLYCVWGIILFTIH